MIPMPLPTIYALKFRPDLKTNIVRLRDEKEQLRKNGDEYGWGNCRYDIAENFWGDKLCRSAYKRSPDESLNRIIKHIRKVLPKLQREPTVEKWPKKYISV